MKYMTPRIYLILGIVSLSLTVFAASESFADVDEQNQVRQNAINEQLKMVNPGTSSSENLVKQKGMTLKEAMADKSVNSVNAVKIIATFNFADKSKTIDSFNVFKQMSGFDKSTTVFKLQGVVGIDKSLLYRAADTEYVWGTKQIGYEHRYSEFGVKVSLEHEGFPIRTFDYRKCIISDYSIDTLHDNDYSYSRASTFVLVDNFEFTCVGYNPYHFDYEEYIEKYGMDGVMDMDEMKMGPMGPKMYHRQ